MTIIAIIGPSGSGKDTVARMIADNTEYNLIVSYTTRPMREGETDGVEHHFKKRCDVKRENMLAYTEYGGYKYWTTVDQIQGTCIYVIDEEGVRSIMDSHPDIKIVKVLVTANRDIRKVRGVTEERMDRDDAREQFPVDSFDFKIHNNKSIKALEYKVRDLVITLKKQQL